MQRFKRGGDDDRGAIATEERVREDDATARDRTPPDEDATGVATRTGATGEPTAARGTATRDALQTARARQRDEYGGINWGSSFFGWLVAVGVAALLTAILAAAGAAIGLTTTTSESELSGAAKELSLGGAIALLAVLLVAYYAGGYVAGRMSRFDGARQGMGTWAIGLIVTVGLAVAALVLGDEYNVLEQLNLPSLPVGDETFATGGLIALGAILLGTLVAAIAGGKVGERYHKKVDRAGFVD
jgi:amino acid transporter